MAGVTPVARRSWDGQEETKAQAPKLWDGLHYPGRQIPTITWRREE